MRAHGLKDPSMARLFIVQESSLRGKRSTTPASLYINICPNAPLSAAPPLGGAQLEQLSEQGRDEQRVLGMGEERHTAQQVCGDVAACHRLAL